MNNSRFNQLYAQIWQGNFNNIDFGDACDFVEMLGFHAAKTKGTSHHVYKMEGIMEIINLQNYKGKAKPYQIRQIRSIIKKYKLGGDEDGQD